MADFSGPQPLLELVASQKKGIPKGIYSVCSANPYVLEACMLQAMEDRQRLLVETTSNQVNQYGGYTGMTPADFADYLTGIAGRMGFPVGRLILGGDHLGPNPWQDEPAEAAMTKALNLIQDTIAAGYTKIHLDASMRLGDDDPDRILEPELSAQRAALLCRVAEDASHSDAVLHKPVYVIGTEVPLPGGTQANPTDEGESSAPRMQDRTTGESSAGLHVTSEEDARQTVEIFKAAFEGHGLQDAWQRVIALVVQPGVEFGHAEIHPYDRSQARGLSRMIESIPGLVFEAHSTDYQLRPALKELVEDHFAILKVGPGLTFAFREAVFALARMEAEWLPGDSSAQLSQLVETVDAVMLKNPGNWMKYYSGTPAETAFARKYSFSDRIRYYWPDAQVSRALERLFDNLNRYPLPLSLISQYLPVQYRHIRQGLIHNMAQEIIGDHIREVVQDYASAC